MGIIRVSDYITQFIEQELSVKHVFMVAGGGMMFLTDGLACNNNITAICCHHEQAAAFAACGYAKQTNGYAVAMVTTGCGGTNAITGLLNAFQDSSRVFFINGQTKIRETIKGSGLDIRQFGVQEANMIPVVESISKYAVTLDNPLQVAYVMEKAKWISANQRPGPVWIEIPMDVQGAFVDSDLLEHFSPPSVSFSSDTEKDFSELEKQLGQAQRPIIIAGQGIKLADCQEKFSLFVKQSGIPFVASFMGADVLPSSNELFVGTIGVKGSRAANFAVQNSDFVLSIGCRLSVSSIGHEFDTFARGAKVFVVDIDATEHQKQTIHIDKFIQANVTDFFGSVSIPHNESWKSWSRTCLTWKEKWSAHSWSTAPGNLVSVYDFTDKLSQIVLNRPLSVVTDTGSSLFVISQCFNFGKDHRYIATGAQAEMGFALPAAIGAAIATQSRNPVVAICGDGGLQMNIQELQTLYHHQLPLKLFVWNNDGYLTIRNTIKNFFSSRFLGTDSTCGVSFPSLEKIASAYQLRYIPIRTPQEIVPALEIIFSNLEPVVCEVFCIRDEPIVPAASSRKMENGRMKSLPLEDMYPFLPRDEFLNNMIIPPIEECK